jgi:sigma-B regulation protein RsbU (phosphoserine phosphatase)
MVTYSAMLATLLAGPAAGIVYKLRKGKLIGVFGAAAFAIGYEVFHFGETLLLGHPFSVVFPAAVKAFPLMIVAHAVGLALFVFILKNMIEERTMRTAKERIESELSVARDIQMSIVPKIFPPFPNIREIDVHASIESAKEVGGDLYDFFFVDDDRLFFVIGDVSGKGVPASLFMAVSITLLKTKTKEGIQTDNILYKVNNDLCADNEMSMFVTTFCGILNIRTGEVIYSNGGHNPPYLRRSSGEVKSLPCQSGLPLGVMEDFSYGRDSISLQPGDTLVLYTDGVTEAINKEEEFFSDGRLEDILRNTKNNHSARDLVQSISGAVHDFAVGAVQSDDITLLVITYNGPAAT